MTEPVTDTKADQCPVPEQQFHISKSEHDIRVNEEIEKVVFRMLSAMVGPFAVLPSPLNVAVCSFDSVISDL